MTTPTATDEKLGADLTSLRVELVREISGLRGDLGEFPGAARNDLGWVKRIGASLLAGGLAFAGWVTWDIATLTTEIRQHGARFDKIEKQLEHQGERFDRMEKQLEHQGERLDRMEKQLEILIQRTAPKSP